MHFNLSSALYLVLVFSTHSFGASKTTEWRRSKSRIFSGVKTRQGDMPFVMKLEGTKGSWFDKETSHCTAFLIHPRWLLTAAHCKDSEYDWKLFIDMPPESGGPNEIEIAEFTSHPHYSASAKVNYTADLALVHVAQGISSVTPVKIANVSSDPWNRLKVLEGALITVAGYGYIDQEGTLASELYKTFMFPRPSCPILLIRGFNSPYSGDSEPLFCLRGGPGQESPCGGDSGGPVMFEEEKASSRIAFGLVSFGTSSGCNSKETMRGAWRHNSWLVRISWHLDWIKEKLCGKRDVLDYMDYQCP